MIHYHISVDSNSLPLMPNSLFLVDSGGQYTTGTTDVTRTVHLGTPSSAQVEDYTEVLKAHVGLASLVSSSLSLHTVSQFAGVLGVHHKSLPNRFVRNIANCTIHRPIPY